MTIYRVPFLNGFYFAGAGTDDVCGYEAVRLGDQLAGKNGIPFFYNWLCWFSNVLVDREDKLSFGEKFFDRTIFGEVFVSVWMDASPKRFVTHTIPPV